jgi:hypothetical protein
MYDVPFRIDCCCVNHLMLTPWRWLEVTAETCRRNTWEEIACSSWHNKKIYISLDIVVEKVIRLRARKMTNLGSTPYRFQTFRWSFYKDRFRRENMIRNAVLRMKGERVELWEQWIIVEVIWCGIFYCKNLVIADAVLCTITVKQ